MTNHMHISRQLTRLTLLLLITSLRGGAGGGRQKVGTIRGSGHGDVTSVPVDRALWSPLTMDWYGNDPADKPMLLALEDDQNFCISADDGVKVGRELTMRPCDPNDDSQLWYFERDKRWRPKKDLTLCVGISGASRCIDRDAYNDGSCTAEEAEEAVKSTKGLRPELETCKLKNPRQRWDQFLRAGQTFGNIFLSYQGEPAFPDGQLLEMLPENTEYYGWIERDPERYVAPGYPNWYGNSPGDLPVLLVLGHIDKYCMAVKNRVAEGQPLEIASCESDNSLQQWFFIPPGKRDADNPRIWRPASNINLCVGISSIEGAIDIAVDSRNFNPENVPIGLYLEPCQNGNRFQLWTRRRATIYSHVMHAWPPISVGYPDGSSLLGSSIELLGLRFPQRFEWDAVSPALHKPSISYGDSPDDTPMMMVLRQDRSLCVSADDKVASGRDIVVAECDAIDVRQYFFIEEGRNKVVWRPSDDLTLCVGRYTVRMGLDINSLEWKGLGDDREKTLLRLEQCVDGSFSQLWDTSKISSRGKISSYFYGYDHDTKDVFAGFAPTQSYSMSISEDDWTTPGTTLSIYDERYDKRFTPVALIEPAEYEAPTPNISHFEQNVQTGDLVLIVSEYYMNYCVEEGVNGQLSRSQCDSSKARQNFRIEGEMMRLPRSGEKITYNNRWNHEVSNGNGLCLSYGLGSSDSRSGDGGDVEAESIFTFGKCNINREHQEFLVIPADQYQGPWPAPKPQEDEFSTIEFHGRCLRAEPKKTDSRALNVFLHRCSEDWREDNDFQLWFIENDGDGVVIRPKEHLKSCLDFGYGGKFTDSPVLRLAKCNPYSDRQAWRLNDSGTMELSHDAVDSFSGSKAFCAEAHSKDRWDTESVLLAECVGGYHQRWEAFGVDTCSRNMQEFSEEDIMVALNEDKSLCIESLYNEESVGLGLKSCDRSNLKQIWAFAEGQWTPKGAPGLCVELGDDMHLTVQKCAEDRLSQTWLYDTNDFITSALIGSSHRVSQPIEYDVMLEPKSDLYDQRWVFVKAELYEKPPEDEYYYFHSKVGSNNCLAGDEHQGCNQRTPTKRHAPVSTITETPSGSIRVQGVWGIRPCLGIKDKLNVGAQVDYSSRCNATDPLQEWVYDSRGNQELSPISDRSLCITAMGDDDIECGASYCLYECTGSQEQKFGKEKVSGYKWNMKRRNDRGWNKLYMVALSEDPTLCIDFRMNLDFAEPILAKCDPSNLGQLSAIPIETDGHWWRSAENTEVCLEGDDNNRLGEAIRLRVCDGAFGNQWWTYGKVDKTIRCGQCGGDPKEPFCISYNTCYSSPEEGISLELVDCSKNIGRIEFDLSEYTFE